MNTEVEAAMRDFERDITRAFVREWILGLPPESDPKDDPETALPGQWGKD